MNHPRFKGAPFNLHTIRWHRTRRGFEWQYWNSKVGRWNRYTRQEMSDEKACQLIAKHVYGCEPEHITIEKGGVA